MLKLKVYLSVFVFTAAFLIVVMMRFDSVERQQSHSFIEAQGQVVLAGLAQALKTEFKQWAYSQHFTNQTLQGLKAKGFFVAHQTDSKAYVFNRSEVFVGDEYLAFFQKYFEPRFSKLKNPKNSQTEDQFHFEPFVLKQKDESAPALKLISLIFQSGQQMFGIVLDAQVFQVHLDMFKSADGQITIMDQSQMILAQSEESYFGTKAGGIEENKSEKDFITSSSIPQTNLSVVYKASFDKIFGQKKVSWFQFLMIGFGFLFLCLGVLSFILTSKENKEDALTQQNAELNVELDRLKKEALRVKAPEPMMASQIPVAVQEKIDQAKNTLSSLAHEMNPHLMAIVSLASRLQKPLSHPEVLKLGQSLSAEIQKARTIIMKNFEYTGVYNDDKVSVSLDLPIQEALRNLKPLLEKNEVFITKDIQTKAPVMITVKHIVRALSELIENSVEAMERMPNKKISIVVQESDQDVTLSITDNGEGIGAPLKEKIFEPFYTSRGFKNKKGLGLSAVIGILKEHDATCTVESDIGKGCLFTVKFPKNFTAKSRETVASSVAPLEKNSLHDEIVGLALQKAKAEKKSLIAPAFIDTQVEQDPNHIAKTSDPDLEDLLSVPVADQSVESLAVINQNVNLPKFKRKITESILAEFAPPQIPQKSLAQSENKSKRESGTEHSGREGS
ncbi:MAG: sensor histidine kinase [Pseudobdellovibrionaceae bacterium]